ncbi:hypothetical protein BD410DRAFT_401484 [Rickenella mellea]|uniref:Glycoside hydrolase 131 catalytic N-terminal domain-containing protein n=1 Tax=Rickenella mellea TaxID=50990 RepID=A0A4Y7PXF4_9AGAM|nr:hypothetical protein BD410DRAFT_401484 [Rickenella mellea]
MIATKSFVYLCILLVVTAATPLVYDGRAPFNLTPANLDASTGPYLTGVKGATQNASHYTKLLGRTVPATPLWSTASRFLPVPTEQPLSVSIDNTSIFVPGSSAPQNGFRRTELLAQINNNHTAFIATEVGTNVYHVSIMQDPLRPLNFDHEYQIVFIEPNDGTHVFEIQLGSPFTNPTGKLPAADAHSFKIRDHALNLLFSTPFTPLTWHNFAIQVNFDARTLGVFYSQNSNTLKPVTKLVSNSAASAGAAGQGDFHFGVLKLPLVDPADTPAEQSDVVHFGIQEGKTEALIYSGVFVEKVSGGVSAGHGTLIKPIS